VFQDFAWAGQDGFWWDYVLFFSKNTPMEEFLAQIKASYKTK